MTVAARADLRRRLSSCLLGALALGPLLLGHPAQALAAPTATASSAPMTTVTQPTQGSGPLVIVLDLSGSMNEKDANGVVRLEGAKSTLRKLVGDQPVGSEIGLWTYPGGSTDGFGCNPGQFTLGGDVAAVPDPAALAAQIGILTADGGTPTGPALRAAADELTLMGFQHATILLVSDGESNCGPPPCEVAQEIVDEGFDVTVDAMGFSVSDAGAAELGCVSSTTGGRYVAVDDTDELNEYLTSLAVPNLDVSVDAPTQAIVGQSISLAATITNPSSRPVNDATVALTFAGDTSQAIFPAVLPPRFRLGNIAPGGSVVRSWTLRAGVDLTGGTASYRVSAWAQDVGAAEATGEIGVNSTENLARAAAPWLRDITENGRLLIMGDSFSSGEGAPPYVDQTDTALNRCHRSAATHTYPQFAGERRQNIACSGAVGANLYSNHYPPLSRQPQNRPQLAQLAVLDSTPDLVVMTLGGNDIGFSDIVKRCLMPDDCATREFREATAARIRDLNRNPESNLASAYRSIYDVINSEEAIAERQRLAPLLVLAYPQPLPLAQTPGAVTCAGFDQRELVFAQGTVTSLNRAIELAVEKAADGGRHIYFVRDTVDAVQPNHTACDREDYIRNVTLATGTATWTFDRWLDAQALRHGTTDYPSLAQQFVHPNEKGYQALTVALYTWSTGVDLDLSPDQPRPAGTSFLQIGEPSGLALGPTTQTIQPGGTASAFQGSAITIQAGGFEPHSPVTISLNSVRQALGTSVADADGEISQVVTIPATAEVGSHTLQIEGSTTDDSLTLSATVHVRPRAPYWIPGLIIVFIAAVVSAGVLAFRGRRSRRGTPVALPPAPTDESSQVS